MEKITPELVLEVMMANVSLILSVVMLFVFGWRCWNRDISGAAVSFVILVASVFLGVV